MHTLTQFQTSPLVSAATSATRILKSLLINVIHLLAGHAQATGKRNRFLKLAAKEALLSAEIRKL